MWVLIALSVSLLHKPDINILASFSGNVKAAWDQLDYIVANLTLIDEKGEWKIVTLSHTHSNLNLRAAVYVFVW
jgi:hypothetical protein